VKVGDLVASVDRDVGMQEVTLYLVIPRAKGVNYDYGSNWTPETHVFKRLVLSNNWAQSDINGSQHRFSYHDLDQKRYFVDLTIDFFDDNGEFVARIQ